jgi:chromosome partitioning protein
LRRSNTPPEQFRSIKDVTALAKTHNWPVVSAIAHHSDSYPAESRSGDSIFRTAYASDYVKDEFHEVADEVLSKMGF